VIIVGAGPTGLALALALARQSVPTLVLDRGDGGVPRRPARSCVLPPDTAHWARLPGAAREAAVWEGWRTTVRGKATETVTFSPQAAPQQLPVHALERALRDAAAQEDLVRIATGCRLTGIEQDEHGVTAQLLGPDGAERRPGSHLVGCDGARSTVRKLLRVPFPGRTSVERYAVATLRAELPHPGEAVLHRALPGPGRETVDEVTLRPLTDGQWRLDWPLPPDDAALVTPQAVLERIAGTLAACCPGPPPPHELLDAGVYVCHQRLARRWRRGRVLLAGDAAHLLGALGTQQVAEGLRDADNLAWKLAIDWHHGDAEALLDSYQHERRTAVGARLRAVDQALPLVRGRGGLSALLGGGERGRLGLLTDAALGRGALGSPGVYELLRLPHSLAVATAPGTPAADVAVTDLDGNPGRLRGWLGGPVLLVLTAPGATVWEPRHWLSAGLMPELAGTVESLPLDAQLLVTEEYPGAPAHTVLIVRPDGRLAGALPGTSPAGLCRYAQLLRGHATGGTPAASGRD
jgi:3-(3-hydroxy-phenyl)propionate hydroxylase